LLSVDSFGTPRGLGLATATTSAALADASQRVF
jgi:hypothetical protein